LKIFGKHIFEVILALFANFEAKRLKKSKNVLYKCVLEINLASIYGSGPYVKYGGRSPKFIWAPCAQLSSLAVKKHRI
jgi:hypothetical protein